MRTAGMLIIGLMLGAPGLAPAQSQAEKPCTAPQHRQFDFWVGEWEVTGADGKVAGHNVISRVMGDCVLHESWKSANSTGQSFNAYDSLAGRWHQTWVDSLGQVLLLDGGLDGERMVLRGTRPGRDGGEVLHEIAWTPNEDGSVTQHWRASKDEGKTWRDLFVGTYRKR